MSQHGINVTVPVQTTTEYRSWGIILAVGVVIFLMAVVLFIYYRERPLQVNQYKTGSFTATLYNTTFYPFTVQTTGGTINLAPNASQATTLGMYETIIATAILANGGKLTFSMHPTTDFNALYITEGGFGTPLNTNTNVDFSNMSQQDILFVLVAPQGRRRFPKPPSGVPAGKTVGGNTVIIGQTWQVVNSTDSQNVLAEKVVRVIPSKMTFDGTTISVQ